MARCNRCNSFRLVGEVKMYYSPAVWIQDEPGQGHWEQKGAEEILSVCAVCQIRVRDWMTGKDQRLSGQLAFEQVLKSGEVGLGS